MAGGARSQALAALPSPRPLPAGGAGARPPQRLPRPAGRSPGAAPLPAAPGGDPGGPGSAAPRRERGIPAAGAWGAGPGCARGEAPAAASREASLPRWLRSPRVIFE